MINTPKPKNPVLVDLVISFIQDALFSQLTWLNYAFGRSQKLIKLTEFKR